MKNKDENPLLPIKMEIAVETGDNFNEAIERRFKTADRALQEGDTEFAKTMLDDLLRDHPTHFRSLMLQSAIAMARGRLSKSEMYARAAIKALPPANVISLDRAVALSQLIDTLNHQGKVDEAAAFIKILGASQEYKSTQEPLVWAEMTGITTSTASKLSVDLGRSAVVPSTKSSNTEASSMPEKAKVSGAVIPSKFKPTVTAQIKDMAASPLWTHEELRERKVVYVGMRQRDVLNAFREVRIKLMQKNKSDNMVVMVSSLKERGGGSFFAFNLAATFALDPQKTALLVDCNPYESSAERYINGVVTDGLSQYLIDDTLSLEQIIYPSGLERVRVIPAAGSNESAAELFNSARMKSFIEEIKARYPDRFIILDAPSIERTTEARILTQYCDQALLLVPFGRATKDEVLSGVEAIGKQHFAGLVFNH